jgi:adenylate cyclase
VLPEIDFKKFMSRREVSSILTSILKAVNTDIGIQDLEGNLLLGEKSKEGFEKYPVEGINDIIGWVTGKEYVFSVVSLLNYLTYIDYEKRSLASELLDKYKEVSLLYDIAEGITSLNSAEAGTLILEKATRLIKADSASIMLFNKDKGILEVVSGIGKDYDTKVSLKPGEGVAGHVLITGKGEIINKLQKDPRFIKGNNRISSLICIPLRLRNETIGVMNISTEEPFEYTSEDYKVMTTIATLAVYAISAANPLYV